jgi:hypothetical protein
MITVVWEDRTNSDYFDSSRFSKAATRPSRETHRYSEFSENSENRAIAGVPD